MLKIAHHPIFCYAVPETHRFPMAKYRLLPEYLLQQGIISQHNIFSPQLLSETEILTTHTPDYWHKLKHQTLDDKECRAIGLPMSPELVFRERYICHATYECALYALNHGVSLNTSGGTHHAFSNRGEGFCVLNDICIASHLLLERQQTQRILIVDLDVHQGNGNAEIMANNPNVFVLSMHGKNNYPFQKPASSLDIHLENDTDDDTYLDILQRTLPDIINHFQPDFIFYQAGVDVLAVDKLGKLSLSLQGCYQRDEFVLHTAYQQGIPICVVMGGGYAPDVNLIVQAHSASFSIAQSLWG